MQGAPASNPPSVPPEVGGLGRGTSPDLYRKLLWLTGARLLVGTALLWAAFALSLGPDASEAWVYFIIGGTYFASLVSVFLLRARKYLGALAHAQIAADVAAATGLVYVTGGAESIFAVLYPLAIVNAAIGLGRRGAALGAAGSALCFSALAFALERGWVGAAFGRPSLPPGRLALTLAANLSAFLLTAALAAYLTEQLRGARQQLAQRETELRKLSALHQQIVLSIGSGILTTDREDRVTYLNPTGEEIVGRPLAELVGRPAAELSGDLAASLRPEGRGEARLRHPDGQERVIGYAATGLAGSAGHVIVFQDLTGLRQMEEAMRRADRLASIGRLAAGLAHEIRNPLASMTGSIELLSDASGLRESERRLLGIVLREAERLDALVRDFLGFARPPSPEMASVDLVGLAEEALAVFRQGAEARALRVELLHEGPVRVLGDARQLKQVLWNLLANAADATAAGGRLGVRLGAEGGQAALEVKDSGSGIAPDDLGRIFDPFFTTKERGTGLGLATVHRIVEAHGGRVAVQSELGRGSTFRVLLPLDARPAAAQVA